MSRIDAAWNELSGLVEKLGPDGLIARAGDGWTVKDHLAHLGAWESSLRGLIEGQDRLKAMGVHDPVEESTDVVNEAVFSPRATRADRSPPSVLLPRELKRPSAAPAITAT